MAPQFFPDSCHFVGFLSPSLLTVSSSPSPSLLSPSSQCYEIGMCKILLLLRLRMSFPLHYILLAFGFRGRIFFLVIRYLFPALLIRPFLFSPNHNGNYPLISSSFSHSLSPSFSFYQSISITPFFLSLYTVYLVMISLPKKYVLI